MLTLFWITFLSLESGESTRIIMPHTIVDNGLRWHVRAFDTKSEEFRDFVITRVTAASFVDTQVEEHQSKMADNQWLRIVPLELIPPLTTSDFQRLLSLIME